MNARRTGAVALKVLRGIRRDKRTLALAIFAPVFAMIVFGFVFGTETKDVPVVVVDDDRGTLAGDIVASLDRDVLDVTTLDSWDAAQRGVRDGEYRAAVRFPPSFTEDATPRPGNPPQPPRGATVSLVLDGTNSQAAEAAARALSEAMRETIEERGGRLPADVSTSFAYAEDADFMDFFLPGIMAFAVLMFTTLLTVLAFVGERTSGTLGRLLVTPVRESEIVLGYALAFSIVGVAQAAVLLAVALFLFDGLVVGSVALVFLIVGLLAVDALSLGILLSAAARRESQAVQLFPLVAFPTFLLSGIFVPVESLPDWLAPLAWAIPPTYAVEALRDVMLRGWGIDRVWWHVAALVAFAVAFLALSAVGLRRGRAVRPRRAPRREEPRIADGKA